MATRGSFADGKAASLYAHEAGTLKAALVFGLEDEEEDRVKKLIAERASATDAAEALGF